MAAPVCHVSVDQVINQPPGRALPVVVAPKDLKSAITAINQLTRIVNIIGGTQYVNFGGIPGDSGIANNGLTQQQFSTRPSPKKSGSGQDGRWNEVRAERVVEKVRIEQKDNPENWVEFERINAITYVDSVTGEKWSWRRK